MRGKPRSTVVAPNATLKINSGGTHSLGNTAKDLLDPDLLEFAKG